MALVATALALPLLAGSAVSAMPTASGTPSGAVPKRTTAATTTTAAASPAAFGPKTLVGSRGCFPADIAARPSGTVVGFAQCGSNARLTYLVSSGGKWSTSSTPFFGDLIAVADDGVKTYGLVVTLEDFRLVVRDGAGKYTSRFLAKSRFVSSAGLVARGGKWLAVWAEQVNYETPEYLYEAGTWPASPRERTRISPAPSSSPELALGASGSIYLAYETGTTNGRTPRTLLFSEKRRGAWGVPRVITATVSSAALAPDVAFEPGRLLVSYTDRSVPFLSESTDGGSSWRATSFETDWGAQRASVAVSNGTTYVGFGENAGQNVADGTYGSIWVRQPGRSFARTVLTPDVRAITQDEFWVVVAARGRATALLTDEAGRLYARTQR